MPFDTFLMVLDMQRVIGHSHSETLLAMEAPVASTVGHLHHICAILAFCHEGENLT